MTRPALRTEIVEGMPSIDQRSRTHGPTAATTWSHGIVPWSVSIAATRSRTVGERGWALSLGEREPDLTGVAVPVLDRDHELVAILGVQGPGGRFGRQRSADLVGTLQGHARTIASAF
jgi:DNA-binding IclR family transcriptional regulator